MGHSIIPWHDGMMLGDNTQTLLPLCHEQMEAEANYVAGRLLFMGERFKLEASDSAVFLALGSRVVEGLREHGDFHPMAFCRGSSSWTRDVWSRIRPSTCISAPSKI